MDSPQHKFYINTGYLPIWNPWAMLCSHCPINDLSAIYTIPFILQLCYKPLGILLRVTKSQKVHISNHDGLENLHNVNFFWHRSQVSQRWNRVAAILPFPNQVFWEPGIYCSSNNRSIILWLSPIHHVNICKENSIPIIKEMEEVHQPQHWLRNIISSFRYT